MRSAEPRRVNYGGDEGREGGVPMYDLRRGEARTVGTEGVLDECGEHFDCSGAIPGGLEVQGRERTL